MVGHGVECWVLGKVEVIDFREQKESRAAGTEGVYAPDRVFWTKGGIDRAIYITHQVM